MIEGDLTNPSYWSEKQKHLLSKELIIGSDLPRWLYIIEPFLREYEGKSFVELGCSPGYASSIICSQIQLIPFGIDFSPLAYLYLRNMAIIGQNNATLITCDIREFKSDVNFDVVASFGLIEHFKDPSEMMFHHHRLAKVGGLIIMVIPNFRYIQWIYHFLFDRKDLSVHNTNMMNLNNFIDFSKEVEHKVLYLGYVGKLRFWNVDLKGPKIIVYSRRILSRIVREFSNKVLSKILPPNLKYYSPWIVYVGRKQ